MAKVIAPLMSFAARGQVANALVFYPWKGVNSVRQYVVPANPNTIAQQETRGIFKTIGELWKRMPTLARAPWEARATGQPYTATNRLMADNIPVLRGEADMDLFVGSPGAHGGIPPLTMVVDSPGALDLNFSFTQPVVPAGWTQQAVVAAAFIDGDPSPVFITTMLADEDAVTPFDTVLIPGLTAVVYQCRGWNRYVDGDGLVRYSVALAQQFTPSP